MRILLSNDDGIHAAGLAALANAFSPEDEIWVVAPDREQSATSRSISLHRPLRMSEVGLRRFSVDGTPTDAVYMGLNLVMKNCRPDIVISGINHGPNLGDDVIYSGTVAAAMAGALQGIRSMAISLASPPPHDFSHASRFATILARKIVSGTPSPLLLNVNVPAGPIKGYRFVRLGRRDYGHEVIEKVDPRGRKYFWIGGENAGYQATIPDSDCVTVFEKGLASVTPLHFDETHDAMLSELQRWTLEGYGKEPAP